MSHHFALKRDMTSPKETVPLLKADVYVLENSSPALKYQPMSFGREKYEKGAEKGGKCKKKEEREKKRKKRERKRKIGSKRVNKCKIGKNEGKKGMIRVEKQCVPRGGKI
jgi:hypothetical protein